MFEEALRRIVREEVQSAFGSARTPRADAPAAFELLTLAQAAAMAGCGIPKIRKLITNGKLTKYGEGRSLRVDRPELVALLKGLATKNAATPSEADLNAQAEEMLGRR